MQLDTTGDDLPVRQNQLRWILNIRQGNKVFQNNRLPFSELAMAVEDRLTPGQLERLGSIMWYVTTVKLDLEVKGELERVPGARPQRLRRSAP